MSPSSKVPYVELRVPSAESEQEFLFLAVQAAVKKYRESRTIPSAHPEQPVTKHIRCEETLVEMRFIGNRFCAVAGKVFMFFWLKLPREIQEVTSHAEENQHYRVRELGEATAL